MSDILEAELKSACRIYSEQKAIRMEKELQFQKLARLEVNARNSKRLQVRNTDEDDPILRSSNRRTLCVLHLCFRVLVP